jgi:hypothetical protein
LSHFLTKLIPVVLLVSSGPSHALDARHPDPMSVVTAAFAAQNVGNVDATVAFYTDDALITNTRGKAMPPGREGVREFHEANRDANVQLSVGPTPRSDGNKITTPTTTTIEFFARVGLGPEEVSNVIIVEGDKIKSFLPYYPMTAVDQIDRACREHGANVPFFGWPCSEFVTGGARAHTVHLIAVGIVENR